MAGGRRVTQADRDRVAELHAEGKTRNDIAEIMDRSGSTISRIAERLGLSFERAPEVVAATEARKIDLAARRAELAFQLTVDAERLRSQMWEETTVYSFGGKANEYNEHTFDEAPAGEKRALMGAAGMAIDRSLKLEPIAVNGSGADDAKSMLGKLASGIAELANQPDEPEADGGQ
ncbi:helix-turn-helix domain-containing protein [Streptomyces sp. NPDC087850]|uniref:helix-turn-helix domain-containing protein n=1 Tax=Streptomyces sp. NPDC087850 TaxID=3365809 RepID=UPI003814B3A9